MTYFITPEALATEIRNLREMLEVRLGDNEKAIGLARTLMEDRMSGFPGQFVLKGEINTDLAEMKINLKNFKEDIARLKECQAVVAEKASHFSVIIAYTIAITGLILSLVGLMLRDAKI